MDNTDKTITGIHLIPANILLVGRMAVTMSDTIKLKMPAQISVNLSDGKNQISVSEYIPSPLLSDPSNVLVEFPLDAVATFAVSTEVIEMWKEWCDIEENVSVPQLLA